MNTALRDRCAEIIYGDGDLITWPKALELANLIVWEIRPTIPIEPWHGKAGGNP